MSHELVGERFVARGRPGWHKLGRTAPENEKVTASQWVAEVTRGAEVIKVPMTFEVNGVTYKADEIKVVRLPMQDDPHIRQFGTADAKWTLETYDSCAKVFDKLSETYPVETAGLIKNGAICFVSFKAEDWDVKGDKVISYIVLAISMKPGVSHHVMHTVVRVVCNNTLVLAGSMASLDIRIPHGSDSLQQLALSADIIEAYTKAKAETKALFESMAEKSITVEQAARIFEKAYPAPAMPGRLKILYKQFPEEAERITYKKNLDPNTMADIALAEEKYQKLLEKNIELREFAMARYTKFDTSKFEGTVWAAYNAATEVSDWREGRNADESLLFGARAKEKERAFVAAAELVSAVAAD